MYREFILGNNQTGLLVNTSTTAIGGEDPSILLGTYNVLPGETSILYGSGSRTSYYVAPSASIASWNSFFANVVASESAAAATVSASAVDRASSGAAEISGGLVRSWAIVIVCSIFAALSGVYWHDSGV